MKLEEAIKHTEDVIGRLEEDLKSHTQLYRLLMELQDRRAGEPPWFNEQCDLDVIIESCKKKSECDCTECGREHQQIAEWLAELKDLRDSQGKHITIMVE